ncbi:TOMM precursor leader peptide-binding protein [Luedemannella flava]
MVDASSESRADYLPVRLSAPAGDYLVVVGEARNLLVEDPIAAELMDHLDGRTETAAAVAALASRYPRRDVATALRRLIRLDLLVDGATTAPDAAAAAWDARGLDPDEAGRPLPMCLVDAGAPDIAALESQLLELGMKVTAGEDGDGPLVVAAKSPTDPRLAAINRARLADGRGWTMVRPHGTTLLLGPHFLPGETACWDCLRLRWTENEPVLTFVDSRRPGAPPVDPARASIPATVAVAAGLLAAELPVLAVHGRSPRLTGRLVTFDTLTLTGEGHDLRRQPYCPSCGGRPEADGRIELVPSPVAVSADGGSRSASAEETYRRLNHHVDRYLGVVNKLQPMVDYHNGLTYSFGAGHNFALPKGRRCCGPTCAGSPAARGAPRCRRRCRRSARRSSATAACGAGTGRPSARRGRRSLTPYSQRSSVVLRGAV